MESKGIRERNPEEEPGKEFQQRIPGQESRGGIQEKNPGEEFSRGIQERNGEVRPESRNPCMSEFRAFAIGSFSVHMAFVILSLTIDYSATPL